MTEEEIVTIARECLQAWPLYTEKDHVEAKQLAGGYWWVGYCGDCPLVPFTGMMRMAKDPPHLFELNVRDGIGFLLFIQIQREYRGLGLGPPLYDVVCEICRRLGCTQLRQTPSGGYGDQTREDYLLKRGWIDAGGEVYRDLQTEVCHEST